MTCYRNLNVGELLLPNDEVKNDDFEWVSVGSIFGHDFNYSDSWTFWEIVEDGKYRRRTDSWEYETG